MSCYCRPCGLAVCVQAPIGMQWCRHWFLVAWYFPEYSGVGVVQEHLVRTLGSRLSGHWGAYGLVEEGHLHCLLVYADSLGVGYTVEELRSSLLLRPVVHGMPSIMSTLVVQQLPCCLATLEAVAGAWIEHLGGSWSSISYGDEAVRYLLDREVKRRLGSVSSSYLGGCIVDATS